MLMFYGGFVALEILIIILIEALKALEIRLFLWSRIRVLIGCSNLLTLVYDKGGLRIEFMFVFLVVIILFLG